MQLPPDIEIQRVVEVALAEDIGNGDVTTLATVPESAIASAKMVAREPMVVCGLMLAEKTFTHLSSDIRVEKVVADGRGKGGDHLAHLWTCASGADRRTRGVEFHAATFRHCNIDRTIC
jgi:nicotinate-nucleotide pyrophosphorylase